MNRSVLLAVLLSGALWGASEVFLGEALYALDVPYASIPLTVVGLCILSIARAHVPRPGTSLAVAACAVVYKLLAMLSAFVDTPLFACHLGAILLLGATYDAAFSLLRGRAKALAAAAVPILSNAAFALAMTFVVRYRPWMAGGWEKIARHVGISGVLCGAIAAGLVPLCFRLPALLGRRGRGLPDAPSRRALGTAALATAVLWVAALASSL